MSQVTLCEHNVKNVRLGYLNSRNAHLDINIAAESRIELQGF